MWKPRSGSFFHVKHAEGESDEEYIRRDFDFREKRIKQISAALAAAVMLLGLLSAVIPKAHAEETGTAGQQVRFSDIKFTETETIAETARAAVFDFLPQESESIKTGWIEMNGQKGYIGPQGELLKGWQFLTDGDVTGWFYFGDKGIMCTDPETPDGYTLNENHVWTGETVQHLTEKYSDNDIKWKKSGSAQLSGLYVSGMPAEFYMLAIAGECSGLHDLNSASMGDYGRGYGMMGIDYRYSLVEFMNDAYSWHKDLWQGFEPYLTEENGSSALINNPHIANTFLRAYQEDYETAVADQCRFMKKKRWDSMFNALENAGFHLKKRSIAVSSYLFSINIACGCGADVFINNISPDVSDEEFILEIKNIRNSVLAGQDVGGVKKGTTVRTRTAEPKMALDLLNGYITIDSTVNEGGGVEWYGNIFSDAVTTIAVPYPEDYAGYDDILYDPETDDTDEPDTSDIETDVEDETTVSEEQGPGAMAPETLPASEEAVSDSSTDYLQDVPDAGSASDTSSVDIVNNFYRSGYSGKKGEE
jgi:hypothetical protein